MDEFKSTDECPVIVYILSDKKSRDREIKRNKKEHDE